MTMVVRSGDAVKQGSDDVAEEGRRKEKNNDGESDSARAGPMVAGVDRGTVDDNDDGARRERTQQLFLGRIELAEQGMRAKL
ncbi:hypothetical protein PIB30_108255 [Stylosanthes scabra]|uniref:Uncharacterized protein n=1 Tax=Stylosanthes scabra TaxID=79078 RepID=A0ABU6UYH9_9FABA|nr:hypothetical protein [Stylosanthes scabra]